MTRTVDFRYILMRGGADYGEIYAPIDMAPTIRMDTSGEIKTSLRGTFLPAPEADWLSDEIRPELIIDGVPHPLGIYLPASVRDTEDETERGTTVEAYDRSWRVRDTATETILSLAAGTNYLTAVKTLLAACGIVLIVETPTTATLTERREDWDVGTSYLKIVNELLSEINYNPLWFDASGAAILEPASVPTAENIEHTLDASNVENLLLPSLSRETDVYSAPNVFLCVCSNADKSGPLTATSENTNPQSPLSIMRRGRRIVRTVRVNNIASQAELQSYADRLRNESMIGGETVIVKTALLPGFGPADVTALHFGELNAICLEQAYEMELRVGGSMTHTLKRVVVNLG